MGKLTGNFGLFLNENKQTNKQTPQQTNTPTNKQTNKETPRRIKQAKKGEWLLNECSRIIITFGINESFFNKVSNQCWPLLHRLAKQYLQIMLLSFIINTRCTHRDMVDSISFLSLKDKNVVFPSSSEMTCSIWPPARSCPFLQLVAQL